MHEYHPFLSRLHRRFDGVFNIKTRHKRRYYSQGNWRCYDIYVKMRKSKENISESRRRMCADLKIRYTSFVQYEFVMDESRK